MKNNDDEAAFPHLETGETGMRTGMTLRDYFAAKALFIKFGPEGSSMAMSQRARMCYEMADAMLEARK